MRAALFSSSAAVLITASLAVLCFADVASAQVFPGNSDTAAKVISLTGQVSILKDSDPWDLHTGDLIQERQVIITGPDGFAKFQVSDGSTFEVFPNSNVIFRKNPPNLHDLLEVLVGRVKIHIQRWGGQPNPNRIHTPTAVISVRGTTFDVSVDEQEEATQVTVEEGQVDVRHAFKGGEAKIVNAGETLTVYRNQPLASTFVDKGAVFQRVLRSLTDAVYTAITNTHGVTGVPGSGTGASYPGQTGPPAPPTAPPAPPARP